MRPPLSTAQKAIVWTQVALAVLFGGVAIATTDESSDWADLARVAAAVLAGAYLAGVLITALAARHLVRSEVVRGVVLLFGPFLLAAGSILALRWV